MNEKQFWLDFGEVLMKHDARIGWSHRRECFEFELGNHDIYIIAPINADDCERMAREANQ